MGLGNPRWRVGPLERNIAASSGITEPADNVTEESEGLLSKVRV